MIRRRWSPREIALGAGFLAAMIALLSFYVWYQSEAVYLGLQTQQREKDIRLLNEEIRKLELEEAKLLAPTIVAKTAREKLALVLPDVTDIYYPGAGASGR
jgi:cell division protein FtsL